MRSGAIAALGQDLADFIGGLDLSNLAVAGHDWGARAAYVVGALFDRRLRGLVAMSAGYATAKPVREMSYDLAKAYWYEWLVATKQGSEAFCKDRRRLCRYLWETEAPGAPEHEELEKQLMRHPPIRVPTIVLHGANDADNFPETSAGKEQFFLDGCERRVLEGVGHFVPREAPGEVVSAIRQILA